MASVTGSGDLGIDAQETLALNGSVSLTGDGSVNFNGWYGTLAIGDAAGFSSTTPIYNFMPGDTIDLKNVPFVSSASSYSFTWGSNGGPNDLKITEGGHTYNFNVGSYYDLSGLLTLKKDASGTGTAIVYTSGGASPFQQWGSPLSNFFTTSSGPVDGSNWALSNSDDGGQPVWIETETPASTYVAGQPGSYSIVLTTQDWIGTQQPLLNVTTTNLIDPFSTRSSDIGNLAGSVYVANNGATGTMDLIYWQASTTPGDYAVEFQPITTTYAKAPSVGTQHRVDRRSHPARRGRVSAALLERRQQLHVEFPGDRGLARLRHLRDRDDRDHLCAGHLRPADVALGFDDRWNDRQRNVVCVSYSSENGNFFYSYSKTGAVGGWTVLPDFRSDHRSHWAAQPPSF